MVPYAVAAAWGLLLFYAFHPGRMSVDSIDELIQGRAGTYTNWHPPVVSWLMGFAAAKAGSPWPVLALQLAMLAFGFAVLCHRTRDHRILVAGLFVLTLTCSPIWSLAVVLWKDVLMAGILLCAVASLRCLRPWLALSILVCASLTRHNALLAALPLMVPAAMMLANSLRVRLLAGLAALGAMVLAPSGADRLLDAKDASSGTQVLAYDIAGICARAPNGAEHLTFADTNCAELAAGYSPVSATSIIFPPGRSRGYSWFTPRKRAIAHAWRRAVIAHPRAYLAHRWAVFQRLMSLDGLPNCYATHDGISPNPWGYALHRGRLLERLRDLETLLKPTVLFQGWLWMALAFSLAVLSWYRRHDDPLPFSVATSGFLYSAEYLLVSPTCDFRYVYWTVVASCATAIMLGSTLRRQPAPSTRPLQPAGH
ncbi:MAG TPA: hypothetical protein VMK12_26430 [Anaeromyxobacteraceae bacterium]|nr:hypothetical protein [Anaeromyxobacteraceae bacterium]